jgi:hypothetical protein
MEKDSSLENSKTNTSKAKELINTSSGELVIPQFNRNEIQEILQHILTSWEG